MAESPAQNQDVPRVIIALNLLLLILFPVSWFAPLLRAGIDLPLRVVVYAAADGTTRVGYYAPTRLVEDHSVPADLPALKKMTGPLDKLTNAAIGE